MDFRIIVPVSALLLLCGSCNNEGSSKKAQTEQQMPEEGATIRQLVDAYTKAMNKRDVNALADFWADEAIYRNHMTGTLAQGKDEIKVEFKKIFDQLNEATIEIEVQSVHFPFDDKASVEGIARLSRPGQAPIVNDEKIIFVKRNGKWLILNVSKLDLGLLQPAR